MATSVTQSLFGMTPEALQQQRSAALQEQALQFARLTPMQQAQMGLFTAGSQLGTGLAGLMGYKDPEEERIKARQGLLGGLDMNNPEALRQAAQSIQAKDPEMARQLYDQASKIDGVVLDEQVKRANISKALTEATTTEQRNAAAWADTKGTRGTAEWAQAYGEKLKELTTKAEGRIAFGQEAEIASKAMFGKSFADLTQPEADAVRKELERAGVLKAKAGATSVSQVVTNKAAEAFGSKFGQLTGEQAAQVEGKYAALDNISDAMKLLDQGIYAGLFGPEKLLAAKATGGILGDPKKIENTEAFLAYIGNVVIPRLQDFGGNDSVEELKYLRSVMAGDQRLETGSMKRILASAEKAIKRGIDRLKRQTEAVGAGGVAPLDAGPGREQPRATKRFNPATGKLEEVR